MCVAKGERNVLKEAENSRQWLSGKKGNATQTTFHTIFTSTLAFFDFLLATQRDIKFLIKISSCVRNSIQSKYKYQWEKIEMQNEF